LCCGRNTAESCRKWSKSTGEYDYIDACWSSCALCSDDAYKILNTPVVYNEKIIDPELLLPLDAELLYYSIQSAKRQQEQQQKSSSQSISVQQEQQLQRTENQQDNPMPFTVNKKDVNELPFILPNQESNIQSETFNIPSQEQPPVISSIAVKEASVDKSKDSREAKSSKTKTSAQSVKKKTNKNSGKKPTKNSRRSQSHSKKKSIRSQSRSKRKSRSKTKT